MTTFPPAPERPRADLDHVTIKSLKPERPPPIRLPRPSAHGPTSATSRSRTPSQRPSRRRSTSRRPSRPSDGRWSSSNQRPSRSHNRCFPGLVPFPPTEPERHRRAAGRRSDCQRRKRPPTRTKRRNQQGPSVGPNVEPSKPVTVKPVLSALYSAPRRSGDPAWCEAGALAIQNPATTCDGNGAPPRWPCSMTATGAVLGLVSLGNGSLSWES